MYERKYCQALGHPSVPTWTACKMIEWKTCWTGCSVAGTPKVQLDVASANATVTAPMFQPVQTVEFSTLCFPPEDYSIGQRGHGTH